MLIDYRHIKPNLLNRLSTMPFPTITDTQLFALESHLTKAQLQSDWQSLEKLLSINLIYIHSNGYVDNFNSYLEKIKNHIIEYQRIDFQTQDIIIAQDFAIKHSIMSGSALVLGQPKLLHNKVVTTWAPQDGNWKLHTFQSTAIE